MKKRVAMLLIFGCFVMNLGACSSGQGEVDYNLGSTEGNSTEAGQETESVIGSTLAQFADAERWTENFTVTRSDGQKMEVQIDGQAKIPEADHMSVIEVKAVREEDLDFSVIDDMAYPVKKSVSDGSQSETSWAHDWRSYSIGLDTGNFGALHVPEEKRDEYLRYGHGEAEWEMENQCSLSMEEAEQKSAGFLEKMGISVSNYQIEEQTEIFWDNGGAYAFDIFMIDGYYFRYVLKDDLGNDLPTSLENYINIDAMYTGTYDELNPTIEIYMLGEGALEVKLYNAVQVIGITKVQNYMSFESIKQSLRNVLSEDFDQVYIPRDDYYDDSEELIINSMELTYFRIHDKEKEGYYSYIPVWLFCHKTELDGELIDDTVYNPILINALDGSVIYLEDEL